MSVCSSQQLDPVPWVLLPPRDSVDSVDTMNPSSSTKWAAGPIPPQPAGPYCPPRGQGGSGFGEWVTPLPPPPPAPVFSGRAVIYPDIPRHSPPDLDQGDLDPAAGFLGGRGGAAPSVPCLSVCTLLGVFGCHPHSSALSPLPLRVYAFGALLIPQAPRWQSLYGRRGRRFL